MNDVAKDNHKAGRGQVINFVRDSYLDRTSRPVYALLYSLPFLLFYTVGAVVINPDLISKSQTVAQRLVSFVFVQNFLEYLGFSGHITPIAAPLAVVVILLAMQITSRTRWYVRLKDFIPMTMECIMFIVPLIVLSLALNPSVETRCDFAYDQSASTVYLESRLPGATMQTESTADSCSEAGNERPSPHPLLVGIVTGVGAGIYEELVFRLILICLLMLFLQDLMRFGKTSSVVMAVIISSLLFSAHHHIFFVDGQFETGELFCFAKFTFRMIAGIYFAVLFAVRGFGIAVGTHAFYDITAAFLNYYSHA